MNLTSTFREQNPTTPPLAEIDQKLDRKSRSSEVPVWNHDEVIRNNLFVNNVNAQGQGWFDIATERHWPRAMQTGKQTDGLLKSVKRNMLTKGKSNRQVLRWVVLSLVESRCGHPLRARVAGRGLG